LFLSFESYDFSAFAQIVFRDVIEPMLDRSSAQNCFAQRGNNKAIESFVYNTATNTVTNSWKAACGKFMMQ
jgi:hypothetical protein